MTLPAIGLTKLSPNKITFQIVETTIIEPQVGAYASIPVHFAQVKVAFHVPGLGDVEREYDLFATPIENGEAMKIRIGKVLIPGQGALFADITAVLWRVPEIKESFARAFEAYEARFAGRDV